MNSLVRITRSVTLSPTTRTLAPDVNRTSAALGSPNTLASQAGFTLPLRKKQPPKNTICATFFAKLGSSWIACQGARFQRSASILLDLPSFAVIAGFQHKTSGLLDLLALCAALLRPFSDLLHHALIDQHVQHVSVICSSFWGARSERQKAALEIWFIVLPRVSRQRKYGWRFQSAA